jgi:uncharacterized protein
MKTREICIEKNRSEEPMNRYEQEDLQQFADRYMAVWNEADAEHRAQHIRELWAEDGIQFTRSREIRGHQALLERISSNYETFVKTRGFLFRLSGDVDEHHDAVKLTWEMVPTQGGEAAGAGVIFLLVNDDGRIRLDYQF